MTEDGVLLEATGVTRRFGGLVAVDDVDLTVHEAECVGLIGPNGAGKTTFFNAVSGFDRRRGDHIVFAGENVSSWRPSRRARVGLARTFQGARVLKELSVDEHLWIARHALPAARRGQAPAEREVAFALSDDLGLPAHGRSRATDLPYGLLKVLGIVMSLSAGARLLMLDEPVAGLDEDEAEHVELAIKRVRETGVAIFVIDHHLDFVTQIVDRLVVMNFGKKIADGGPAEVLDDPMVREAYVGS